MAWAQWVVVALLVQAGGWMAFDGMRALVAGDYTTPSKGEYAGQLGPWAGLVSKLGIEPRGTPMKVAFVVLGVAGLAAAALLAFAPAVGKIVAAAFAVLTLWYLPFGTLISVVDLVLLGVFWRSMG